jgi:hypothetical protein
LRIAGRRTGVLAGALWAIALGLAAQRAPGAPAPTQSPIRNPPAAIGTPELVDEQTFTLRDRRLGADPIVRYWQVYVPRSGMLAAPKDDPKFRQRYLSQCVVRAWEQPGSEKNALFSVRFSRPEDEALARRVGGVLARVYWLGVEYLGVPRTRPVRPVDVWLCQEGKPGAEQYHDSIYLYAAAQDRPPAEWVREIAHEYSHLALPEVGPFTAPERWANGYLGERLFLKWLVENGLEGIWGTPFSGPAYLANQITPLRDRFLDAGPTAAAARLSDGSGMEHFIGFALAIEASYGPRLLREAVRRAPTVVTPSPDGWSFPPAALSAGLAEAVKATMDLGLRIDPRAYLPERSAVEPGPGPSIRARRASYWLFLPSGTWNVALEGTITPGTGAQLEAADGRLAAEGAVGRAILRARVNTAAWRRLQVSAGPAGWFELAQIELRRVSAD